MNKSLILIGMPGAGKSTLGVVLAKELASDFIDTDVLIQVREGKSLQDILDTSGYLQLRRLEEEALLSLQLSNHVIATGGSAVYSDKGMQHLKQYGPVVFLDVPLAELKRRIHNYEHRGIARRPEQSFADLFKERHILYSRYADIVIECQGKSPQQVVAELMLALNTL